MDAYSSGFFPEADKTVSRKAHLDEEFRTFIWVKLQFPEVSGAFSRIWFDQFDHGMLIPREAAHRFRDDGARLFRNILAH